MMLIFLQMYAIDNRVESVSHMEAWLEKMKTGLVLEGGAMRGMYTAGALDYFLDVKVPVDGIMGVSAGALFGISYAAGQRGRSLRYSKRFNGDKRYISIGSWIRTGNIVNTEFAYGTMPRELDPFDDEAFQKSGIPFWAVVTNIETGKAEYPLIEHGFEQMDQLRASGSMPFLSKPVEWEGKRYLDGGVADPIPYDKMLEMGFDRLIVILTRDNGYQKAPMSPTLINLFYHKYPEFAQVMKERDVAYNDIVQRLHQLEDAGTAIVLRPSGPIEIGRLEKDPDELQRVYDIGREDARKFIAAHPELLLER